MRRTTSQDPGLQTVWTSKSVDCHPSTATICTCWTSQRSNVAEHRHLVFHTETIQPHKLLTARYTWFNEHNSTKLEEWLTDIETTADLTSESRARLTETKSRVLMHTLVTEAITSNKFWDNIKDLLQLKLCNADIHMYTLQFMEIQQWEKESLTAYVHWFKT